MKAVRTPNSHVIAMAGYDVDDRAVASLKAEWICSLSSFGVDELHMKEIVYAAHGKYSHWEPEKKRELLEVLVGIIHRHSLVGIGAALEWRRSS